MWLPPEVEGNHKGCPYETPSISISISISTLYRQSHMLHRTHVPLLLALLLAAVAAWPLLAGEGLLNTRGGGDSPFLVQRLHQMETAVRDGHFPVRWMPDSNYGYGYPFFNYYAPLSFYIALAFRLLGFSLVRAIQLSQLAAFLTAAWASYRLGQRWWQNDTAAFLSAVLYTFAPFHLVNVYVRGDSIAEFWAMAFFPLVLLAIMAQTKAQVGQLPMTNYQLPITTPFLLALAYAGLLLSHNISALIFSPFALLVGLMVVGQSRGARLATLGRLAVGAVLGVALSAWFWLPALAEQEYTQLAGITADYFHYSRHFRPLAELTQTSFLFSYQTSALQAFRMGFIQTALLVVGVMGGLWHIRHRSAEGGWLAICLLATAAATLMMMPLAQPVWDTLPLLPFTQFPWRFLSIQAFFGALLVGGVVAKWTWVQPPVVAALVGLVLFTSLGDLRPDYLPIPDEAVTAEAIAQYEWFTGNIGTTINHEYLTPAVQPRPVSSAWLNTGERWTAQVVDGTAEATLISQRTDEQVWRIVATEGNATITLPLMYWPGWTATAKYPVTLTAARGSGLVTFTPPAGVLDVTLRLRRTPTQWAAELLSLATAVGMAGLLFRHLSRQPRQDIHAYISPFALDFSILAVLGLIALGWWDGQQTPPAPVAISQDFGEMGFLHPTAEGIRFTNGAHLTAYTTTATTVAQGQPWHISLRWADATPLPATRATVVLTTPATYFYNDVAPLAQATAELTLPTTPLTITIPADAPPGLYFPQILWEDGRVRPLTPAGKPRAPLSLPPVRVVANPAATAVTAEPLPSALAVRPVQASQRTPTVLDVSVAWFTPQPLGESYKTSWRLISETGIPFHQAQFDSQPGYGYWPTVAWPAGEWVQERVALFLPEERPFPPPYVQTVTLYDHATQEVVLTRRLGVWLADAQGQLRFAAHQPNFSLPTEFLPLERVFSTAEGEQVIALRGFTQRQTAEGVAITLYWEALQDGLADYHHFVHLIDPFTKQPLVQHDTMPRNNTYPTSQWVVGEIVADELFLPLADVPAGQFHLVAGLYRATKEGYPRLLPRNLMGQAQTDGWVFLQDVALEK